MITGSAALLHTAASPAQGNPIPSSSPGFGTPVHPLKLPRAAVETIKPSVLTILLPPATLRPVAFRTFTKKHNLTLTSSALQALALFIGKHCGSGWREEGLAERVLEEVARSWKKNGGGVIVDGDSDGLKSILHGLEGCMSGGRVLQGISLGRHNSIALGDVGDTTGRKSGELRREESQTSLGMSTLELGDEETNGEIIVDPRKWLEVIGAFEQPRLDYSVGKKHFERSTNVPSLLPLPSHKTHLFRYRFHVIHQRLLRNDLFQTPSFAPTRASTLQRSLSTVATRQNSYKLTSIANLLGRSGSSHLILGLLTIAPTGTLSLSDLSGSISLDLQHAKPLPENGAWFTPGMIVLVDGIYEELGTDAGAGIGGGGGVGGTIGGRFIGLTVEGPPCERREVTLGIKDSSGEGTIGGGGFGWVDFLGVGSERAVGSRMRRMEQQVLGRNVHAQSSKSRSPVVVIGEVNLDSTKTQEALKTVLGTYAAGSVEDSPMTVVLVGNFVQYAVMAGGGSGGSIEYKEYFDSLASILADFPSIIQHTTFIFVPGDNDPWASSFSGGAATPLPRRGVPDLFTTRIKRAFATANSEAEKEFGKRADGEAIWTTNPSRISLFGPTHEIVIFRDDISGRLRRNAIKFRAPEQEEPIGNGVNAISEGEIEQMDIDHSMQAAESPLPTAQGRSVDLSSNISADVVSARKLVKTILDQGYLSPFPLSTRPVLWDYVGALQLYPVPTALVLVDPGAPPFAVTYEGCHVMNPGKLLVDGRRGMARWIEYDARTREGKIKEAHF